jgi:hypothetical protein
LMMRLILRILIWEKPIGYDMRDSSEMGRKTDLELFTFQMARSFQAV